MVKGLFLALHILYCVFLVNGLEIGDIQKVEQFDDPERSRAYLGGLTESREYRIYVWALTKAGQGEEYYIDAKTANPGRKFIP